MPEKNPSDFDNREDWMEYCMDDSTMQDEYPDQEQRSAVCLSYWENKSMRMPEGLVKGARQTKVSQQPHLQLGKDDDGNGYIEGYAATFGNVDQANEVIEPGAFHRTIRERVPAGKVKLMAHHFAHGGGTQDVVGTVTEAKEDNTGLWVHGEFASTDLAQETRALVSEGHVKNLSVGYEPLDWEVQTDEDGEEIIHHKEMMLYDVTITAIPVNEQAVITAAKSAITAAGELRSQVIAAANGGDPSASERLRQQFEGAARDLRTAADSLEAVCDLAGSGDTSKAEAAARWLGKVRRRRQELEEVLAGKAFRHSDRTVDEGEEPAWSDVDKTKLPEKAFVWQAPDHEAENVSTWSFPHHFVRNGSDPDEDGRYTDGDMYLHRGGLAAARAAAAGARSGQEAPQAVKDHLDNHPAADELSEEEE